MTKKRKAWIEEYTAAPPPQSIDDAGWVEEVKKYGKLKDDFERNRLRFVGGDFTALIEAVETGFLRRWALEKWMYVEIVKTLEHHFKHGIARGKRGGKAKKENPLSRHYTLVEDKARWAALNAVLKTEKELFYNPFIKPKTGRPKNSIAKQQEKVERERVLKAVLKLLIDKLGASAGCSKDQIERSAKEVQASIDRGEDTYELPFLKKLPF